MKKVKIVKIRAKSIFTRTKISNLSYSLNQYVGCMHSCLYCYAKYICKWKNYGKWGDWVEVKINAPELVRGKFIRGNVFMSTVSDPYQPIERKFKLTRKILENMNKKVRLLILTKSNLIIRDINIFNKFENINIGLTLNGFDGKVKRNLEPYAPVHEKRVQALKELKEEGLRTYAFISPIIPKLVEIEEIIKETKDLVNYYIFELINIRLSGGEFLRYLIENHPKSYEVLINQDNFSKFLAELKDYIKKLNLNAKIIQHKNQTYSIYKKQMF